MMFYKTFNSNEIFETNSIRFFEVGFRSIQSTSSGI